MKEYKVNYESFHFSPISFLYLLRLVPVNIHVIYLTIPLLLEIPLSQKLLFFNSWNSNKYTWSKKWEFYIKICNKKYKSPSPLPHTTSPPQEESGITLILEEGMFINLTVLNILLYFYRMLSWSLNLKV